MYSSAGIDVVRPRSNRRTAYTAYAVQLKRPSFVCHRNHLAKLFPTQRSSARVHHVGRCCDELACLRSHIAAAF
ncbi:hypothetical protein CY34DRAFT_243966 [Suillus luteus UH-Slu-Lm8-n1]|uniref:Uncharacterized protein n=1 Tax=Suillus luteus UH-Slu-Lm8-n1 TaxID=930992 RepID=A0A0D0AGH3_9AGAM|nr:hypothetical protein CY34DRAFT_243966 [Suillus luteus UH-Slu-Lm8-n1]